MRSRQGCTKGCTLSREEEDNYVEVVFPTFLLAGPHSRSFVRSRSSVLYVYGWKKGACLYSVRPPARPSETVTSPASYGGGS